MEFFQELGTLVEQRWRAQHYCEEHFPELAAEILTEWSPHQHVDPWEVIHWINTTPHIPTQPDLGGRFGDPPITVYAGPRFHIDMYFWLDGSTNIHQHAFCGAFQVHRGSSIHSRYRFHEDRRVSAHFSTGQLTLEQVELLQEGEIRQIWPGRQSIHSLFHLDRPSVSTIIRTYQTPNAVPQYNYQKPYFAVDTFFQDPLVAKKIQSAILLLKMPHPEVDTLIGDMIVNSDFHTVFALLELAFNYAAPNQIEQQLGVQTGQERFDYFLQQARRQHGELVDLIQPVLEENQRVYNILIRRGQITSNEHRFFLALLLNVPERQRMLDLVRQRFPDQDPVDTVTEWLEELADTQLIGSSEPNVLGIQDLDDDYLFAVRCLLEGQTPEQIHEAFVREYSEAYIADLDRSVEDLVQSIQQSLLFKAIFSSPANVSISHR
ncbi:MAG: hypothetical protein ETSY2_34155 [Candidatus Entotheonella gemina]|uniref:Uncharacterized protein n=1 Tax=Candidatus Entotheonella gemina TaxID=1429439 RepID=W4LYW0_9BACT|nr:MAG: hypothetical protein ETSY2_34155 [Candidatus Entotheonella gemina]